jgi:hypothetical protein
VLVATGPEWFAERTFAVGERLVVTGEMDRGEFDAFTVTRADGSVDRIRPADGPPPWSYCVIKFEWAAAGACSRGIWVGLGRGVG